MFELIHGDVFEFSPSKLADLVIADPPYGGILKEAWDREWNAESYLRLAEKVSRLLVPGGSAYIWGGVGKYQQRHFLRFMAEVEDRTDLHLRNVITWSKKRAHGKSDDYLFTREEIAWLVKGEKPAVFHVPLLEEKRGYAGYNPKYPAKSEYKRRTNVWTDITEIMRGKVHVAEKPERLSEVMIATHTDPGGMVFDLFAGSGNATAAAIKLGRHSIAVEADETTYRGLVARFA
jgi:DNA modification methylase